MTETLPSSPLRRGWVWIFVLWAAGVLAAYAPRAVSFTLQEYSPRLEKWKGRIAARAPANLSPAPSAPPAPSLSTAKPILPAPTVEDSSVQPSPFRTAFQNTLRIFLALLIFVAAGFMGRRVLEGIRAPARFQSLVWACPLGLGILSYATLFLGTLGLFRKSAFVLILLAGLATAGAQILSWSKDLASELREISHDVWQIRPRILLIFPAALAALLLAGAFIPDPFYDVLQYHLALPDQYLLAGRLTRIPYNAYAGFPQAVEMLYTLGLGLGGDDTLPLLIQAGCSALLGWAVFRQARGGRRGLFAAFLFLSAPITVEHARFCKPDIFLVLCLSLSFFCWLDSEEPEPRAGALLSGILAGLAIGAKYPAIFFVPVLAALWFWKFKTGRGRIQALFFLPILLLLLPWAVKNMVFYKNPFYPFLQNVFGYVETLPVNAHSLATASHGIEILKNLAVHFFSITFRGMEYPSMNSVGPVWLAFFPLICALPAANRGALGMIAVGIILSAALSPNWARYFVFPVLPIFAAALVPALGSLAKPQRGAAWALLAVGIGLCGLGWLPTLERVSYGRTAFFGLAPERREKLYAEGYLSAALWTNRNLPDSATLLFWGETKSHLFRKRLIAPSVSNKHLLQDALDAAGSGDALYEGLKERAITHILFNASELLRLKGYPMFRLSSGQKEILFQFWAKHLTRVYGNSAVEIFAVVSENGRPLSVPAAVLEYFLAQPKP